VKPKVYDEAIGPGFALYNGDCAEVVKALPDRSVGLAVYSPPFSSVYTYSGSERDMGNAGSDHEFIKHYGYLLKHLYRMLRPGRVAVVHCKDLVNYANSSGRAGLRDFPGDLIRAHQKAGFTLHSRVTIWKCPVTEMQRTKAHGLLYKQLRTDSSFSRQGLAEYLLVFRRWAAECDEVAPVTHTEADFPLDQWQQWASPVWMDIDQTNVLNVEQARSDRDEKHMCPLQLDLIERCVKLWSNPGDVVFSPFAGIGSEGYVALRAGRQFVGIELKPEYFKHAVRNVADSNKQLTLHDLLGRVG
jgi:DNA modification methylase